MDNQGSASSHTPVKCDKHIALNSLMQTSAFYLGLMLLTLTLSACKTVPNLDSLTGTSSSSAAAGSATTDNSGIERCDKPLGTLAMDEDQQAAWWHTYYSRYPQLGSTIPVLRMMVQQSNCFVVVERGGSMDNMMRERALMQ
jgi:curli biogenesis system outer membrane secretion channel CsgG